MSCVRNLLRLPNLTLECLMQNGFMNQDQSFMKRQFFWYLMHFLLKFIQDCCALVR